MKIAITGSNGYIGQNLIGKLESANFQITKIRRVDLYNIEALRPIISGTDAVIHLAGAPILQRWNYKNKLEILKSRTETTKNLILVINQLPPDQRPKTFISASAVGIYKADQIHTENSAILSDDFTGNVARQWEQSSDDLDHDVRKVIFRIGIVIGKESGTIIKLLPVFKLGLGGRIGSGNQPFPFIHINDVVNSFFWAYQNKEVHGIFNLVAPENITNNQFTRILAKKLKRPAFFSVPDSTLKLIYGEAASLLLQSPQAIPERLLDYGFRFKFPDIESSLEEILK
jgi:uncharacterized protein (TIGR01777 family)